VVVGGGVGVAGGGGGGGGGPWSLPKLPYVPMFPHVFLICLLLINLLTTYHRPQFPPAKNDTKNKTSICVTSSQAFERNSQSVRVG